MRKQAAWAIYWLGDLVHRWNDNDRRFTAAGYRLSQWLLLKSSDVQGDEQGPWWRRAVRK